MDYYDYDSDGTEDVAADYAPEIGWVHALVEAAERRGFTVDTSHLSTARRDRWAWEEGSSNLALGDHRGRLGSETLHHQLAREAADEGRRLSQQIAWAKDQGWTLEKIERTYGETARRIRKKVMEMASGTDTDAVLARIRRMGVPEKIQQLILSLPVHVLAQTLMAESPEEKRFPVEPPERSVLLWEQVFPTNPDRVYTYAALRAADQWWMTGSQDKNPSPVPWSVVEQKIGNSKCFIATNWGEIPPKPTSMFEGMNPAEWFEQVILNRNAVDGDADKGGKDS